MHTWCRLTDHILVKTTHPNLASECMPNPLSVLKPLWKLDVAVVQKQTELQTFSYNYMLKQLIYQTQNKKLKQHLVAH